jgi:hypothetical protein
MTQEAKPSFWTEMLNLYPWSIIYVKIPFLPRSIEITDQRSLLIKHHRSLVVFILVWVDVRACVCNDNQHTALIIINRQLLGRWNFGSEPNYGLD